MRRVSRLIRSRIEKLEDRINCSIVTNTSDYKPISIPGDITSVPVPGSLHFAITEAMKLGGGTITFNTDPSAGTVFDDPANPVTINLKYGEIRIYDENEDKDGYGIQKTDSQGNPANWHFNNISIFAPKHFDAKNNYVTIRRTGTLYPDDTDANFGTDVSVFDISIVKNPDVDSVAPDRQPDKYHPDFDNFITLDGLKITGGKSEVGAGIVARGFMHLNVVNSEISVNNTLALHENSSTSGAGLAALSADFVRFNRSGLRYGPIVSISNSFVIGNNTAQNDDQTPPPVDYGGGIYTDFGATLEISNSAIMGNTADNGGGGIYFTGGMFYENPSLDELNDPGSEDTSSLFTTYLRITGSEIRFNATISETGHGDGGGLVIANSTGAMIADTTFSMNSSVHDGGAVQITGFGGNSPNYPFVSPYTPFVGTVNFVSCTFSSNMAGTHPDEEPPPPVYGRGGAMRIEGIVNATHIVNCTVSGNRAWYGTGAGISIEPMSFTYAKYDTVKVYDNPLDIGNNSPGFEVDYNSRSIQLKTMLDVLYPPMPMDQSGGMSFVEIENSTVAFNVALGKIVDVFGVPTLFGARGGGIEVRPIDPSTIDKQIAVGSTIVAKNTVSPATGFGPDLYTSDNQLAIDIVLSPPPNLIYGSNLTGIANDGDLKISGLLNGTLVTPLDPQLLPLGNYGGIVDTHALRYINDSDCSPAIDHGINSLPLTYDQRDNPFDRTVHIIDNAVTFTDVGAYEVQLQAALVGYTTWADSLDTSPGAPAGSKVSVANTHSRINRIEVHFSQAVNITGNPVVAFSLLKLTSSTTGLPVEVTATPNLNGTSVNLTFSGDYAEPVSSDIFRSLVDGNYQLKVVADQITSLTGVLLDGDGDGNPGGDYATPTQDPGVIYRLFGDATADRFVHSDDFTLFRTVFGIAGVEFDFNGDGTVASYDFAEFRKRFGIGLAAP